jgi:hypothetical protein
MGRLDLKHNRMVCGHVEIPK